MFTKKKKLPAFSEALEHTPSSVEPSPSSSPKSELRGFAGRTLTRSRAASASGRHLWESAFSSSTKQREAEPRYITKTNSSSSLNPQNKTLRKSVSDDSLRVRLIKDEQEVKHDEDDLNISSHFTSYAPASNRHWETNISDVYPHSVELSHTEPRTANSLISTHTPTLISSSLPFAAPQHKNVSSINNKKGQEHTSIVLAIIGSKGVGKSTIIHAGFQNISRKTVWKRISSNNTTQRGRVSFYTADITVDEKPIRVDVYEVDDKLFDVEKNHFEWPKMGKMPNIDAVLLCYDATDGDSMKVIPDLLNSFHQRAIPTLLIGCKGLDIPQGVKQVTPQTANELAQLFGVTSVEVGVTTEKGLKRIQDAVALMVRAIMACRAMDMRRVAAAAAAVAAPISDPCEVKGKSVVEIDDPTTPSTAIPQELTDNSPTSLPHSHPNRYPPVKSTNLPVTSRGPFASTEIQPENEEQIEGVNKMDDEIEEVLGGDADTDTTGSQTTSEASGRRSSISMGTPGGTPQSALQPPMSSSGKSKAAEASKGYTLDELVDKLCNPRTGIHDINMHFSFFMFYRRFARPREILDMLISRFRNAEVLSIDIIMMTMLQMRICELILFWVQEAITDFTNPKTFGMLQNFTLDLKPMMYLHHYWLALSPIVNRGPSSCDPDSAWGLPDEPDVPEEVLISDLSSDETNVKSNDSTLSRDSRQSLSEKQSSSTSVVIDGSSSLSGQQSYALPALDRQTVDGLGLDIQGLFFDINTNLANPPPYNPENEKPLLSTTTIATTMESQLGWEAVSVNSGVESRPRGLSTVTDASSGSYAFSTQTDTSIKSRSSICKVPPGATSMSPTGSAAGGQPSSFSMTKWNGSQHPFFSFDPLDIAKELTRMDWEIFSMVQPRQVLSYIWIKKNREPGNPNSREHHVLQIARDHFEWISGIISSTLINMTKQKHRARMLELFMEVGVHLRNLNNYQGLMAVRAALSQGYIVRLTQTWEMVKTKPIHKNWLSIVRLLDSTRSWASYRLALRNSHTAIPYLGIHTSDFFSISEGNKDYRPDGKIHWQKFVLLGDVLRIIMRCQRVPYDIPINSEINNCLRRIEVIEDTTLAYEKSYQFESRIGTVSYSMTSQILRKLVEGLTLD